MSMSPGAGIGLKPVVGPQGLRIATSPFSAQPDNKVAAVDVYDVSNPGVINSAVEDNSIGFFDSIKNAISGVIGGKNLPNVSELASSSKSILDTVKQGTAVIRNITNVASRATSALNQIKNGGVIGSVAGLSNLANLAGVEGAYGAASVARSAYAGIQQGGLQGALRTAGALTGKEGASLNQLAGNLSAIDRLTNRNLNSSNIFSTLSTIDSAVSVASSTIRSLDTISQADFSSGFNAVMDTTKVSGKSLTQSTLNKVYTAVTDLTTAASQEDSKNTTSYAGVASGLVTLGSSNGDNNIYSLLVNKGLDNQSAFTAGAAVTTLASKAGNISLLSDIASTDVGKQAIATNPHAVYAAAQNLTPDLASYTKPLTSFYQQLESVSKATGQAWRTTQRAASTVADASGVITNGFSIDVLAAQSAADHVNSERLTPKNALKAIMTDAQVLYAAIA